MIKRLLAWACALGFAGATCAQTAGVVTFTANKTFNQGTFAPVLTWSTTPAATSCQASGGWSGAKASAGSQTQAAISANKSYTLTCTWGSGSTTLQWAAPTTNTNGSALTNLGRYKVMYGTSSGSLTQSVTVDDPTRTTATINSLSAGTWYFAVRAVSSSGSESGNSNLVTKTVTAASAAKTVSIAITAAPPNASLVTISQNVWDVYRKSNGVMSRKGVVGTIALGRPCSASYKVGANHYLVSRSYVTLNKTPASTNLVVYCSKS